MTPDSSDCTYACHWKIERDSLLMLTIKLFTLFKI